MVRITNLKEIKSALPTLDLIPIMEAAFVSYSEGRSVVPPVGELLLDAGEVHIKYGYLKDDAHYVIKIASGFYNNPKLGLPSSNGMMLLFDAATGQPVNILLDEGWLTDIRTAVAGAVAAKYLAPQEVTSIGILGTGVQARLQLQHLKKVTNCRNVVVWGRGKPQIGRYVKDMGALGFTVTGAETPNELLERCNLIVTTTPAAEPLLSAEFLQPGTHITAMGSDTLHKQELDSNILAQATTIVADSIEQCRTRGEIHQARQANLLDEGKVIELGSLIAGAATGRSSPSDITIADLTGVAVQDIAITKAVHAALS